MARFRHGAAIYEAITAGPGFLAADALAMAIVLRPELVERMERHHVAVETAGESIAVAPRWSTGKTASAAKPNASIVLSIDQGGFEDLLASTLEAG